MPTGSRFDDLSESLVERIERAFPAYLTAADKKKLFEHLTAFPDDRHFYATDWDGPLGPLQGDGWNGFVKLDVVTASRHTLSGIVLSNSCDIDENNSSIQPRNIVFAPIIPLAKYEARLRAMPQASVQRIESHLEAIRKQTTTGILYLPASTRTPEAIVHFDDIGTQPLRGFANADDRAKLFRLNNFGFYVFLMKLSIHFTRFGEDLNRGD